MKILLVDDEPLARERLRALLADIGGCDVVAEAGTGGQALELTQSHQPDVLLLDIRMPGMDGIEAANHLARLDSPPAVIFTTALSLIHISEPTRREEESRMPSSA